MKELLTKIRASDIRNIVAVITAIGSFVMMYLILSKAIPVANHDIAIASVGYVLGGANGLVYAWLYSASRADKRSEPATPPAITTPKSPAP